MHALDLKSGKTLWHTDDEVFGTFLNYSPEHDLLLQAGSAYRDRAKDEVGEGMIAYRGKTGKVLWNNKDLGYGGPCLLMKDRIITNGNGGFALDILTGKPTGWRYRRNYGCNTAIGSEHLHESQLMRPEWKCGQPCTRVVQIIRAKRIWIDATFGTQIVTK